jgi:hypothetical protein
MDIILNNKYKIQNLNKGIIFAEGLDSIAYTATVNLVKTKELKEIGIKKGDKIKIIDIHAEVKKPTVLFNGVIWSINEHEKIKTDLTLTCKERTVCMEESETEYLFSAGQTATQRVARYAKDWGIPLAKLHNTNIKLSKAVYRKQSLLEMVKKDFLETAQKGGNLYKLRMLDKLNIIQLGSNKTIWKLETIVTDIERTSSLDGLVTQVKVLGKETENKYTPVIGTFKKDTEKYGTIQKIIQDEKIKDKKEAQKRANGMFNTGKETMRLSCARDINTIRAGDSIMLNGVVWFIIDIRHELGRNNKMDMNVATQQYIRKEFYTSGDYI